MSYRSEVALAIKNEFIPDLIKNSVKIKMLLECTERSVTEDGVLFHWNSLDRSDINILMNNLYNIINDNWRFVEFNNDFNHMKVSGCYYNNPLGYVREIRFDK